MQTISAFRTVWKNGVRVELTCGHVVMLATEANLHIGLRWACPDCYRTVPTPTPGAPLAAPTVPAYNPEDGAPCAQCGHGQELHVNGTEDCWESADATPATFCPCPQFQSREAAQRADEAELALATEGTPEGDAARWLANRGLRPMAGGAPSHYTDPAWLADEAWALQEEHNAASAREEADGAIFAFVTDQGTAMAETALCHRHRYACNVESAHLIARTTPDYDGGTMRDCTGNDALECQVCGTAPHTHPCPTCHVARPCTGTGCADGPRECATCSNCRGW